MLLFRSMSWMISLFFCLDSLAQEVRSPHSPRPACEGRMSEARMSEAGVLVGVVRSAADSTVLPGVAVRVEGTGLSASTRKDGRYRIENVPAGAVTVTASSVGFDVQTRTVQVMSAAETTVDFSLSPLNQALDEVVATGQQPASRSSVVEPRHARLISPRRRRIPQPSCGIPRQSRGIPSRTTGSRKTPFAGRRRRRFRPSRSMWTARRTPTSAGFSGMGRRRRSTPSGSRR